MCTFKCKSSVYPTNTWPRGKGRVRKKSLKARQREREKWSCEKLENKDLEGHRVVSGTLRRRLGKKHFNTFFCGF